MTFRTKLLVVFILALLSSVGVIALGVTIVARRAFDTLNQQYSDALVGQFEREVDRHKQNVANRVQGIADAGDTVRMAIDLSRPQADVSVYVNDAHGVAQSHQLDFVDFVANDGSIISSNEWPARFGYKMDWVTQTADWTSAGAFLTKVDTQDGPAVGLMSVSTVRVGDKNLYIVGGERLGKDFLASLVLPAGMRALLYQNLDPNFDASNIVDQSGPVTQGERFAPFIEQQRSEPGERSFKILWSGTPMSAESFHALPLLGRSGELLGVLLVGSSQTQVVSLEERIALLASCVIAMGLFFGLLMSWWGAARVTRPVRRLAEGAREVTEGNWNARVDVRGNDEMGKLSRAFNRMTEQLSDQRERLVQAERVAAWRELARRLAHELKNPLFPLQTTVENLRRAKEQGGPEQFEEVFQESTGILLSEIDNLKKIIGRFSDFARMPQPELARLNLNDLVREIVKLFEAQFSAVGRPPITPELHLEEGLPPVQADATLLRRAIENLVLNAMDAMPSGGVLMLRTSHSGGDVSLEVSDTGSGLTPEECERLFTPYYTTKQHGTGLGLAIVQSVVSDHGGRIAVESESGVGTSFHIHLPAKPGLHVSPGASHPVPAAPSAPAPAKPAEPAQEEPSIAAAEAVLAEEEEASGEVATPEIAESPAAEQPSEESAAEPTPTELAAALVEAASSETAEPEEAHDDEEHHDSDEHEHHAAEENHESEEVHQSEDVHSGVDARREGE
ncbi:MAG TPA: ATP-binding protein [Candidatus Aquilonibacter sp.]|nr:ATP-binding protein [Candidatus Aquilonibacter sp.]